MSANEAIESAVFSLRMEGYEIDAESKKWCEQLLQNKISFEEYIALIKKKSGVSA